LIHVIGEITAETFQRYMEQADRVHSHNTVFISSPGGDIGYTLAMLDEIDESKRTTKASGFCQSAAAVLATAGEGKRVCTSDTLFRFLPPMKEMVKRRIDGEDVEYEGVSDYGNFVHSLLVARLAARLKTPVADISLMFDGEFISSVRAKELGLIDEIIFTEVLNGKRDSDRFPGSESQADGFADTD